MSFKKLFHRIVYMREDTKLLVWACFIAFVGCFFLRNRGGESIGVFLEFLIIGLVIDMERYNMSTVKHLYEEKYMVI